MTTNGDSGQTTDFAPPQMAWSLLPDDEVRALAQGCREFSCPQHGRFNRELNRRTKEADRG